MELLKKQILCPSLIKYCRIYIQNFSTKCHSPRARTGSRDEWYVLKTNGLFEQGRRTKQKISCSK